MKVPDERAGAVERARRRAPSCRIGFMEGISMTPDLCDPECFDPRQLFDYDSSAQLRAAKLRVLPLVDLADDWRERTNAPKTIVVEDRNYCPKMQRYRSFGDCGWDRTEDK